MTGAGLPVVRVLGPVRFDASGGGIAEPAGALARRLLVALALAGDAGRPVGGLVEDVWDDAPPSNPRAALQMLVSRLRAAAAPGLIVSTSVGYRVAASDLGRAEAVATDPVAPSAQVAAALAARAGDPGADVAPSPLADDLADRALRARAALLTARAQTLLDAGDAAGAATDAAALVRARPFDADAQLLLLGSLRAAGRTAEGAAAFAEHRRLLADALGTDPDRRVTALHAELLRDTPGAPTELVGVRAGTGPLLGRAADLDALDAALTAGRLVTILGTGGLGKTRLAHETALRRRDRYARIVLVELAGTRTRDDIDLAVGAAVGARQLQASRRIGDAPPDLRVRVVEALAARRTLLVLDNCEHVIDAAAALAADLLAAVQGLTVLTTSRVPLLVPGETVHALAPLDAATDGAALFVQRARGARPAARLDPAAVARVVAHLDGLPLAIELAAARLRSMTLEQLEAGLADRFGVLIGGDRTAPERHRTLFAVIDWSWQLLDAPARSALAALSVFPDGCSAESAGALLSRDPAALLSTLVDQSLLVFIEGADGAGRYRMLETVREFGSARLAAEGGTAQAQAGLDRAVLALCRRWSDGLLAGRDPTVGSAVAAEEETLLAALRRDVDGREAVTLAVFALLAEFWVYRGEFEEISESAHLVVAASAARPHSDAERIDALRALALAGAIAAVTEVPGVHRTRVLALLRRALREAPSGTPAFWRAVGEVAASGAEPDQSAAALDLLAADPDPLVAAFGGVLRAQLAENAGHIDEAIADLTRTHEVAERHGFLWFGLLAALSIVQLHSQRAERDEALRMGTDVLRRAAAMTPAPDLAQIRWAVAINQLATGDVAAAESGFRDLVTAAGAVSPRQSRRTASADDEQAVAIAGLAEVAAVRGDATAARALWQRAIAVADVSITPWRVLVGATALAAWSAADAASIRPDDAQIDAVYRRTRALVLALARMGGRMLDHPVFGSGALGLAAVLLDERREPAVRATGAELARVAVAIGARLDPPSLERVRDTAVAMLGGPIERREGDGPARIVALLRRPEARR